jgi:uncharacterized protein YdhG (YjbR/CyaY superfamily)
MRDLVGGKPKDVADYISRMPTDFQPALKKLRALIRASAPKAEEGISYQIPVYKYMGMLVGFGAAKNHCALYVMSPPLMVIMKKELERYDTATGTIRFTPDKPLPATLVKKIVKARIAENLEAEEVRQLTRKTKPKK